MATSYNAIAKMVTEVLNDKAWGWTNHDPGLDPSRRWFVIVGERNLAKDELMVARLIPAKVEEAMAAFMSGQPVVSGIDELDAYRNVQKNLYMVKGQK
jgi:hypothetical protein